MSARKTRWSVLDIAILFIVLAGAIYLGYRVKVGLHYKWDWEAIPQYLFRFDEARQAWVSNLLMQGLYTTIKLSLWGTVLATVIGTVMGLCRVSTHRFRRMVGRAYVEIIRNLPPLVLIFIFYFFISDQIMASFGIDEWIKANAEAIRGPCSFLFAPPEIFSAFLSALITIAIFEGAYITEIVRAGIQSIEKGQWEASYALGLSRWQQMRYVILPQAARRILPPLAGFQIAQF